MPDDAGLASVPGSDRRKRRGCSRSVPVHPIMRLRRTETPNTIT